MKLAEVKAALCAAGWAGASPEWVAPGPSLGYRNRVRLAVLATGQIRFFNQGKSADCPVLEPALRDGVQRLRHLSERFPEAFRGLSHLEVRGRDADGYLSLYAVPGPGPGSMGSCATLEAVGSDFRVALGNPGDATQRYFLSEDVYTHVPLGAFLQVNHAVNRYLVKRVTQAAREHSLESFADLYAGAGNFTLPLLRAGLPGSAVERSAASIAALRRAAADQGLERLEAVDADVVELLPRWVQAGRRYDLLILDPPRAGIGRVAALLPQLAARRVALISCALEGFRRDLAALQEHGFVAETITVLDMFPQTRRVEILCWFRGAGPERGTENNRK